MAAKDCRFDHPISALTYSIGLGFWVNTTCCQGSCQEPTPPGMLPQEAVRWGAEPGVGVGGLEEFVPGLKKAGGREHHVTPLPQAGCPKALTLLRGQAQGSGSPW